MEHAPLQHETILAPTLDRHPIDIYVHAYTCRKCTSNVHAYVEVYMYTMYEVFSLLYHTMVQCFPSPSIATCDHNLQSRQSQKSWQYTCTCICTSMKRMMNEAPQKGCTCIYMYILQLSVIKHSTPTYVHD